MYRFNRLNNLQTNIKKQVTALGQNEETFLSKSLYQNFQDVSQKTIQYINKTQGLNVDWSYLDDKFITAAIKQNWQDGNFSSRLWKNKNKLLNNLNNNLVSSIAAGKSINDIAADLKDTMGTGAYDSLRLARTETMHILNNAQTTSFKKAGYSKVVWIAAEDERTCDVCGGLDGKPFYIANPPDCPLHANCRCTLAADPDSLKDVDYFA
jgi:SPP1 gp7 family putative phage head morphogenesis protein